MIYAMTLNPAIDYVVKTENFLVGELNRLYQEEMYFGGKGINVSRVLKEFGLDSVNLGYIAGFTGDAIKEGIEGRGLETDFVKLKNGNSRINVKVKSGSETELNGKGPKIRRKDKEELFNKLSRLKKGDILVMSGSIPAGLSDTIYEEIMASIKQKGVEFVVDASGNLLKNALKHNPLLIKPNKFELEQLFGQKVDTASETIACAKKLIEKGALNVLVSMGKDGAVFVNRENEAYKITAPKGEAINTVGAGDSTVAGFLAGYINGESVENILKIAIASGSATAFSEDLATKEEIDELFEKVKVEKVN